MLVETLPEFELGRIVATRSALEKLNPGDVLSSLLRHRRCDWGDVDAEDAALNNLGVLDGSRLLSAYHDVCGTKFWIITEWDRSATTVLLPDDY